MKYIKDATELEDIDLIITIINSNKELPSWFISQTRHLCDNFDIEGLLYLVSERIIIKKSVHISNAHFFIHVRNFS